MSKDINDDTDNDSLKFILKDNKLSIIRDLVHLLIKSSKGINGLLIEGGAGLGKTRTVLTAINELLTARDYAYVNSFSTPLSLYNFLYVNRLLPLIVLDDVEGVCNVKRGKGILKAALETSTDRVVCYETTSRLRSAPSKFKLLSKLVVIGNEFPVDADFVAIKDRCYYYRLKYSRAELFKRLRELVNFKDYGLSKAVKDKVFNTFTTYIADADDISLRMVDKAFNVYSINPRGYKSALKLLFEPDEAVLLVKELSCKDLSVQDMRRKFTELTGLSGSTFHRLRRKLGLYAYQKSDLSGL